MKIVYSPEYGSGWQSWNRVLTKAQQYRMITHPRIIEMVEYGELQKIIVDDKINIEILKEVRQIIGLSPEDYLCILGCRDLRVAEISKGSRFRIEDHDGYESVVEENDMGWFIPQDDLYMMLRSREND